MSGDPNCMLSFPVATANPRGKMGLESITQQIRQEISKIESGITSTRRQSEEDDTGTAQNFSGWEKKNCSGPKSKVGENQGREVEKNDRCRLRCD
jgi:hypothetical protein